MKKELKLLATFFCVGISFFGVRIHAQIHVGPGQMFSNILSAQSSISPGDTVYIHKGNFTNYQYLVGLAGAPDAWITFCPFEADSFWLQEKWQFANGSYLKFENLNFRGTPGNDATALNIDNGGDCATQSHHIIIKNCSFYDIGTSNSLKFGGVDDFLISNCSVVNNYGTTGAGIALNVCHKGEVSDCYVADCNLKGLQVKLGSSDITIQRNYFVNSGNVDATLKIGEGGGLNFHCPGDDFTAKDIRVYSNIVIGGRSSFTIGQSMDCEFVNNTFIEPNIFVFRVLPEQAVFTLKNHLIANNIFLLKKSIYFNGVADTSKNVFMNTIQIRNNLFYDRDNPNWAGPDPNGGDYDAEELKGAIFSDNIVGEPLFIDESNANYRPASSSPVLNIGLNLTQPILDFYQMPFAAFRSIGASEAMEIISNTIEPITRNNTIWPNPTSGFFEILNDSKTDNLNLMIFGMAGNLIRSIDNPDGLQDISDLAQGTYMVLLRTDTNIEFTKLIKLD